MQLNNRILTFIFILGMGNMAIAQNDSVQAKKYPTQTITEYELDRNLPFHFEDTVINKNEVYQPMYKTLGVFQDLGNVGSPGRSLFFESNRNTDFYLGFNPYKTYFKTPEATRYYHTKIPYADLFYVQGQRDLLMLNAKFSVNVSPRLNVGVDYDRITSMGFYSRQYTSGYFTKVFSSYQSKNKQYCLLINGNINRGVLDENGGLLSDSLFETLSGTNKAAPVRLYSSQSRFRNTSWYVKQYFYLGNKNQIINGEDTTSELIQSGFISHTFRYDYDRLFFDNTLGDTNAVLFPNKYYDTTTVFYDSVYSKTYMNRLAYGYWTKSNSRSQSFIEFAISHKYIEVSQRDLKNTYHNIWGEAKLERVPKTQNNIGIQLYGAYCMSGYNENDLKVSADLKYLTNSFNLEGGVTNQLYTPDYTQIYYRSDPFVWNNKFSKINVSSWRFGLETKAFRNNFQIFFNQYILANWVYNGEMVTPVQTNQVLVINTLEVKKTFQASLFFFEHRLLVQKANSDLVRLPEFSAILRYYLNGFLFKRALHFQLGADVFYNTAYYGNAYHPSAKVFYLQNQTRIGNYPMIDVFVTGQIKTATLFAKYEHVNMDWSNQGFYYAPGYPLPIRAFRFGIRWRMYN